MSKLETSLGLIVALFAAGAILNGPTLAQAPVAPQAPVAVNAPGVPPDATSGKPATGPQPISAATPRVGPVPTGQVVADDYRIGPSDLLEIQVFGIDNLRREVRVNSRGAISLPLIGTVIVGGLTGEEAETLIAEYMGRTTCRIRKSRCSSRSTRASGSHSKGQSRSPASIRSVATPR